MQGFLGDRSCFDVPLSEASGHVIASRLLCRLSDWLKSMALSLGLSPVSRMVSRVKVAPSGSYAVRPVTTRLSYKVSSSYACRTAQASTCSVCPSRRYCYEHTKHSTLRFESCRLQGAKQKWLDSNGTLLSGKLASAFKLISILRRREAFRLRSQGCTRGQGETCKFNMASDNRVLILWCLASISPMFL